MARASIRIAPAIAACLLAAMPAGAHGNTQFAGVMNGKLVPAAPTFQFTGDGAFAGQIGGAAGASAYACTASGTNAGVAPFGGPFEGTYSCTATNGRTGAAPVTFSGNLKGWTNAVTIAMAGDVQPGGHTFNCEGLLTITNVRPSLFIELGAALACVIQ